MGSEETTRAMAHYHPYLGASWALDWELTVERVVVSPGLRNASGGDDDQCLTLAPGIMHEVCYSQSDTFHGKSEGSDEAALYIETSKSAVFHFFWHAYNI